MSEVFDVRCAIDDGDMDRAVSLVRAMKNPDAQADHGRSCLHFAAWHRGTEKVIAAILECGGNVNIRSDFDGTPLFGAACHNTPEAVKMLLGAGADVKATDGEGDTPLHFADCRNILLLLEAGADVEARDALGKTPLHTAAERDDGDAIELLAGVGADVNAMTGDGRTPLRLAVEEDCAEACRTLLRLGADASLAARDGLTPEAWARAHAGDCGSVLESVFTGQNG